MYLTHNGREISGHVISHNRASDEVLIHVAPSSGLDGETELFRPLDELRLMASRKSARLQVSLPARGQGQAVGSKLSEKTMDELMSGSGQSSRSEGQGPLNVGHPINSAMLQEKPGLNCVRVRMWPSLPPHSLPVWLTESLFISQDQDTDYSRLADVHSESKKRAVSSVIDVPLPAKQRYVSVNTPT